jgi:hypothetical protein
VHVKWIEELAAAGGTETQPIEQDDDYRKKSEGRSR